MCTDTEQQLFLTCSFVQTSQSSRGLEMFKFDSLHFASLDCPHISPSSFDGQDGVVGLAGPADLNVLKAGLVEHVGVLGWRALPALRLHQHVEGEYLSHDGAPPVLKQHGFHQQDAAACEEDEQRHRTEL